MFQKLKKKYGSSVREIINFKIDAEEKLKNFEPISQEEWANLSEEDIEKLSKYTGSIRLHIVPFTEIQEAIHKFCKEEYMITLMRRIMMRIAEIIAKNIMFLCIFPWA